MMMVFCRPLSSAIALFLRSGVFVFIIMPDGQIRKAVYRWAKAAEKGRKGQPGSLPHTAKTTKKGSFPYTPKTAGKSSFPYAPKTTGKRGFLRAGTCACPENAVYYEAHKAFGAHRNGPHALKCGGCGRCGTPFKIQRPVSGKHSGKTFRERMEKAHWGEGKL